MVRPIATSALALIIGAAPVLADVTPAEVWENLKEYGSGYGYTVSGNVEDTGNTLTVTDAVFAASRENGASAITLPKMTFQETGDARVRVTIDGDVAVDNRFTVPAPSDPAQDTPEAGADTPADPAQPEMVEMAVTGTIKMPGNEIVVSGTPDDMLYESTYPSITMDFVLPTEPGQDTTIPLTVTFADLTASQRNTAADGGVDSTFDLAAAQMGMQIDATMPPDEGGEGGGTVNFQMSLDSLTSQGTGKMPGQSFDLGTQMTQALEAGLMLDASLAYEALKGTFHLSGKDETGEDQSANGTFSTGASETSFRLSDQGISYKSSGADAKVDMTVASLPFPVSYAVDRIAADMMFPVSGADAAQPFKLAYAMEGLTLADGIWDLFDPTSQLPRDPASLTVDVSGTAQVKQDLFDSAADQDDAIMPDQEPFALRTMTIDTVALDAAGAKANITGQLDFGANPNEPVGKVTGTFQGVNVLMDKLVAMGVVPQEQMMGLRMMMAMFAKPAEDDPDQLTSDIEFREGGQIFANGQRVK